MSEHKTTCLGCGGHLPKPFLDLGRTPLANAYVPADRSQHPEPTYPLAVAFCPACALVQLTHTVDPKELFSEYLYFSSYSSSFLGHAMKMAQSLRDRFELDEESRVLEIASNDGYLLQYFKDMRIPVLGIEPAANIARFAQGRGIPTLNRFFNPETARKVVREYGQADLIIANNVFAHVPAPNEFLDAVRYCLKPGAHAVFEFPYLLDLLDKVEFDTIYHEHVFYFSLSAVDALARRAGLTVADVEHQEVHGGTLRVFFKNVESGLRSLRVEALLHHERAVGLTTEQRYETFGASVATLREELLNLLTSLRNCGKTIAAYGAPAKGNTLLNYCGIGRDLIDFTVDRNTHKQGHLLPGSRIPVLDPEELLLRQPDYTLILPWNIAPEIMQQQRDYGRRGGRFIIPIPSPAIVGTEKILHAGYALI